MTTELPFGPFLAAAAVFYLFAEPWIELHFRLPADEPRLTMVSSSRGRPSGRADHRRRRAQRAPRRHDVRRDPPRAVRRASATCAGSSSIRRCWKRTRSAIALTDPKTIATATALEHPNIVPTVAVEAGGPDVVIVTRGVGRYVTVQDLIAAAKAKSQAGRQAVDAGRRR